jgi:hypothetical protein
MDFNCQVFQAEIVEIAESGSKYSSALSAHITACSPCRRFLLEQLGVTARLSGALHKSESRRVVALVSPDAFSKQFGFEPTQEYPSAKLTGIEASRWVIWAGVTASYLIAVMALTASIDTSSRVFDSYLIAFTGLLPALFTTVIAVASYLNEKIQQVRFAIVGLGGVVLTLMALFSHYSQLPLTALVDYLPIVVTFLAYVYRDHYLYKVQVARSIGLFDASSMRTVAHVGVSGKDSHGTSSLRNNRRAISYLSSGTVLRPIVMLAITLGLLIEVGLATATPTSKSLIFSTPVSKTIPIAKTHHSCSGSRPMQL